MAIERIASTDFQSLSELKSQAKIDSKSALPQVAKQFEGIFLQTLMKTMRMSQHFIGDDNPFRTKNQETFQEMLDGQYVNKMVSSESGIGIADILVRQLGGTSDKAPANKATLNPLTAAAPIESQGDEIVNKPNDKVEQTVATIPATTQQPSSSLSQTIDGFVQAIWVKAKEAASVMGVDPKVLVAQAALETGWGKHVTKDEDGSTSNNLFNIKASAQNDDVPSVKTKTTEYIADTPIKVSASFRKYSSVDDSFNDYVSFIKGNDRYQNALANAGNPERYLSELSKAGYATDPHYSSKIMSIYNSDELNQAVAKCAATGQI